MFGSSSTARTLPALWLSWAAFTPTSSPNFLWVSWESGSRATYPFPGNAEASPRALPRSPATLGPMRPAVEIAVPVHNEERVLEQSVRRLCAFCAEALPWSFRIVIADNASADGTRAIGERLAAELDAVAYLRLSEKGRGRGARPGLSA